MENPPTSNDDATFPELQALHIPTEVCENIIDMLYSDRTEDTLQDIITLHSCAVVCRAWRVRSQKMLFYKIQLSNSSSFRKLAEVLDAAQHLRGYVHEVRLTGYHLQTTKSILAPFLPVFARKLSNLERIYVDHIYSSEGTTKWYPSASDLPKSKSLPYIPLHPHFPVFLSTFTRVSFLYLGWTKLRSFTEFARILHGLPNLEQLECESICWITLGGSYPGADFTEQPEWAAGKHVLPPFASKLRALYVRASTMFIRMFHDAQRICSFGI